VQDRQLKDEAVTWQAEVERYYIFNCSELPLLGGVRPPTLNQFRWAVATVESRAFCFRMAGGSAAQAIVPIVDMANHGLETGATCSYDSKVCHSRPRMSWLDSSL
jgi:hypothetical protein